MSRKLSCPVSYDELKALYAQLSTTQLAEKFNTSRPTIRCWLKAAKIVLRTHSENGALQGNIQSGTKRAHKSKAHAMLGDRDWLYEQRMVLRRGMADIARDCDCTEVLVKRYVTEYGFPEFNARIADVSGLDKDTFQALYDSGLTFRQIADKMGMSHFLVWDLSRKLGIQAKPSNSYDRPFKRVSSDHTEIDTFIRSIYDGEIKTNNRRLIGSELDIYIPEHNFAIEFNGLYYHSEDGGKDKNYHLNKTKGCWEHNVFLFHIYADLWDYKRPVVESIIRYKLKKIERTEYARKLEIRLVEKTDRRAFFAVNHLQSNEKATMAFGLYKGDELMACMAFGAPRSQNYDYELVRFANKINTNVVGGFSRLLKHARQYVKGTIVSYADLSYATGDVYKRHGFEFLRRNPPDYMYVDRSCYLRINKRGFEKKQIAKKYGIDITNMTEAQLMESLKFKRIWNCGTDVWLLK